METLFLLLGIPVTAFLTAMACVACESKFPPDQIDQFDARENAILEGIPIHVNCRSI